MQVSLELALSAYPRLSNDRPLSSRFGGLAVFLALTPTFFGLLTRVAQEKERHVTGTMRSIGLSQAAYHGAYWLHACVACVAACAVTQLSGLAFGLPLFVHSDGGLLFLVMLCYSLCMAGYAIAIASTIHRTKTSALVGFAVLLPCATLTRSPAYGRAPLTCGGRPTSPQR